MAEAYIVEAVRTAGGRRGGKLMGWHPADMAGEVLSALVRRSELDGAAIDDVVLGCVTQAGEQSFAFARNAVLASDLPQSVPAVTVDRQCGSSQQALHFAAQGVMAGAYDIVVAAGVESMSRTPMGASVVNGELGMPFPPELLGRYPETGLPPQGIGAEMIADEYELSREGSPARPRSGSTRRAG